MQGGKGSGRSFREKERSFPTQNLFPAHPGYHLSLTFHMQPQHHTAEHSAGSRHDQARPAFHPSSLTLRLLFEPAPPHAAMAVRVLVMLPRLRISTRPGMSVLRALAT